MFTCILLATAAAEPSEVETIPAYVTLSHRNYSAFAELPGFKLLHLHRADGPDAAFLQLAPQLQMLGVQSAVIDCAVSSSRRDSLRKVIGACIGGTYRVLGPEGPFDVKGKKTAWEVKSAVMGAISCDDVVEITDGADLKQATGAPAAIVLFTAQQKTPKFFCHIAMILGLAGLRFGVVVNEDVATVVEETEDFELSDSDLPAVKSWVGGYSDAAVAGKVHFDSVLTFARSVKGLAASKLKGNVPALRP